MKKKCGLLQEFKTFITRGNVIDLAVGMIIGAAFTAIVNALVNNIFKPLINCIPMGDLAGGGLITMLVPKDANGVECAAAVADLTKSVYIDWGAFIMAVINFLLTAVILFAIIKVINSLRGGVNELNKQKINLSKEEKAQLKAQGMNRKQMKEYADKKAADEAAKAAEEAAKAAAEAAANAPETTDQILKDIRDLLRSLQPQQAAEVGEKIEKVLEK